MQGAFPFLLIAGLIAGLGLLTGCGEADAPDDAIDAVRAPEPARIMTVQAVLDGAHVPTLDPHTMKDAEIRMAVGAGPRCEFRYTSTGRPVLAVGAGSGASTPRGVLKLNGSLIVLELAPAEPAAAGGGQADDFALVAEPIRALVAPVPGELNEIRDGLASREATMVFEVGDSLRVGYRGYLECLPEPPPD
ncbi:hypothetical protein [Arenibaculum sp.]|jgi:hypothetical protein|uniref:hypothetical protein n=1 Tax=Arenibaculum sp. TaxID=2865862 RepID=UPI002E1507FB|nr:hypothetical protein [Arenibaculum sp.]